MGLGQLNTPKPGAGRLKTTTPQTTTDTTTLSYPLAIISEPLVVLSFFASIFPAAPSAALVSRTRHCAGPLYLHTHTHTVRSLCKLSGANEKTVFLA